MPEQGYGSSSPGDWIRVILCDGLSQPSPFLPMVEAVS
ncbi:hypothetical protein SynNOUM97013_01382 [Synechococcus sp. NOUM97013]|nr:hypothetical protein SynNOUM97013_01382 [Synechococcus sp. NOUM97013]